MRYGDVLNRAFGALRSGPLWGFAATAYTAYVLPIFVGMAVFFTLFGSSFGGLGDKSTPSPSDFSQMLAGLAAISIGGLLAIVPTLIFAGGMVHVANASIAKMPFRMSEGWTVGGRRIGRTLGISTLVGLAALGAILVAMIPFFATIAVAAAAGDSRSGAIVGVVVASVCAVLFFYALLLVIVMIASAWNSIALGYGIIGGRTAGDAVASAWKALRARKKNVAVFLLIMFGMTMAYQIASSVITAPVQLLTGASGFNPRMFTEPNYTPDLARMYRGMPLVYGVSFLLAFPLSVFVPVAWVAFFRQLTGMDVPSLEQPPAGPPVGLTPPNIVSEPPAPPAPPSTQPSAPDASFPPQPPAPPAPPAPPLDNA